VVEGVSAALGDLAPLDAIVALKKRHRYRLVVDESLALGALGATGRGAAEHFGLAPGEVDIVSASLGGAGRQADWQTDRQTDRWTGNCALSVRLGRVWAASVSLVLWAAGV
jgi:Aminotransferase class I and II